MRKLGNEFRWEGEGMFQLNEGRSMKQECGY